MTAAAPCLGKVRGTVTVWLTRHVMHMTSDPFFSIKYVARVLRIRTMYYVRYEDISRMYRDEPSANQNLDG